MVKLEFNLKICLILEVKPRISDFLDGFWLLTSLQKEMRVFSLVKVSMQGKKGGGEEGKKKERKRKERRKGGREKMLGSKWIGVG